jgi:hypothetical protein
MGSLRFGLRQWWMRKKKLSFESLYTKTDAKIINVIEKRKIPNFMTRNYEYKTIFIGDF